MFSYSGLTKDQVMNFRREYSVYMLEPGEMSITGCKFYVTL